jgi:replicative DNA helicase
VLFLWQPETVIGTDWHEVELLIAKQRNGPANLKIGMKFNKTCCVFST